MAAAASAQPAAFPPPQGGTAAPSAPGSPPAPPVQQGGAPAGAPGSRAKPRGEARGFFPLRSPREERSRRSFQEHRPTNAGESPASAYLVGEAHACPAAIGSLGRRALSPRSGETERPAAVPCGERPRSAPTAKRPLSVFQACRHITGAPCHPRRCSSAGRLEPPGRGKRRSRGRGAGGRRLSPAPGSERSAQKIFCSRGF